jgi:SAM-dependent methyltransferase
VKSAPAADSEDYHYTLGALDGVHLSGGDLVASGWIVSLEAAAIKELQVDVGDRRLGSYPVTFGPSADVRAAWPSIPGTSDCRFTLRVRLDDEVRQRIEQREVVSIRPALDGRRVIPLERVVPSIVGAADPADSEQVGVGDFVQMSYLFLAMFRHVAKLGRDETILDAGCGLGRMAFALCHYLSGAGRYEGFDISRKFIEMAQHRYRDMPNFRFRHADIYNKMYNPLGKLAARDFRFPFDDGLFSFTFLTSVFTHMLPDDIRTYLREIRRTLRKDGRCFATFFVLDPEAEALMKAGKSTLEFAHEHPDGCLTQYLDVPENAIAYREPQLREMIRAAGLEIAQLHRGSWPGRTRFLSYQDVCLLRPTR